MSLDLARKVLEQRAELDIANTLFGGRFTGFVLTGRIMQPLFKGGDHRILHFGQQRIGRNVVQVDDVHNTPLQDHSARRQRTGIGQLGMAIVAGCPVADRVAPVTGEGNDMIDRHTGALDLVGNSAAQQLIAAARLHDLDLDRASGLRAGS